MIDASVIQRVATRLQTTTLNVAREYCQHLVLSALYRHPEADRVLFKGGTALRIIYGSPRFSEDLDFTGVGIRPRQIEALLVDTLSQVEQAGIAVDLAEATRTSGGYLGIIHCRMLGYDVAMQIEISLRRQAAVTPETALIASDLVPGYTLLHLPQARLVEEKVRALRERGKARDWYDLYFILRRGLVPPRERARLTALAVRLRRLPPEVFRELRVFLPRHQQALLKAFPQTLARELQQFGR